MNILMGSDTHGNFYDLSVQDTDLTTAPVVVWFYVFNIVMVWGWAQALYSLIIWRVSMEGCMGD